MKKLSLPHRQTYLALWRRQCFEGIMQWERVLRILFVEFPKFVFERFEGSQKLVSFFFVYVMLQVRRSSHEPMRIVQQYLLLPWLLAYSL